jgi:DNA-binding transcriptional ArsR family regulator
MDADATHRLSDEFAELVAQRFRALGEPMRLKLLDLLRDGEANVHELTAAVDATPQNVSKHLGVLYALGIVRRSKRGNFVYYSIADGAVYALCEIVSAASESTSTSNAWLCSPEPNRGEPLSVCVPGDRLRDREAKHDQDHRERDDHREQRREHSPRVVVEVGVGSVRMRQVWGRQRHHLHSS